MRSALLVLVVLTGCAGQSADPTPTATTTSSPSPTEDPDVEAALEAKAMQERCERLIGGLKDKLDELDSRLAVGMNQGEFSEHVADAKVVYDRVPFRRLDPECITDVGIHLENALNAYFKANTLWSDCISDYGCSNDDIIKELRAHWSKATKLLTKADKGLTKLGRI